MRQRLAAIGPNSVVTSLGPEGPSFLLLAKKFFLFPDV
jgi:hypothetical protein